MSFQEVSKQCMEERERLVRHYTDSLPTDCPIELAQIVELVDQLEQSYKQYLCNLWEGMRNDSRTLDDLLDKRYSRFALNRDYAHKIHAAQAEAEEVTLWEQITNSNYRDIAHLNTLIITYCRDLLAHITIDFLEDIK